MINDFFLTYCEFFHDWDEGELIEELNTINPHISVAIAMNFFGISQLDARLHLMISNEEIGQIVYLFDKYCSSYSFSVGGDENERVFEKLQSD